MCPSLGGGEGGERGGWRRGREEEREEKVKRECANARKIRKDNNVKDSETSDIAMLSHYKYRVTMQ
eukprot:12423088-Karenia_brevis.AAC.1